MFSPTVAIQVLCRVLAGRLNCPAPGGTFVEVITVCYALDLMTVDVDVDVDI